LAYWGSIEIMFITEDEIHAMDWVDGQTLYAGIKLLILECIYWEKNIPNENHKFILLLPQQIIRIDIQTNVALSTVPE
jgi:hypothetical protein